MANFPERLHRLVIYPVPWVASAVWYAASALLDERTADKAQMLSGPAARTEPIPAGISEYVDEAALAACHAYRRAALDAFVPRAAARLLKSRGARLLGRWAAHAAAARVRQRAAACDAVAARAAEVAVLRRLKWLRDARRQRAAAAAEAEQRGKLALALCLLLGLDFRASRRVRRCLLMFGQLLCA